VLYQGISVNYFYMSPEYGISPDVRKLVCWMCGITGTMGWLTKLPWPVWLGASPTLLDGLAARLPELHSYTTAGSEEACRYETMCASQVGVLGSRTWTVPRSGVSPVTTCCTHHAGLHVQHSHTHCLERPCPPSKLLPAQWLCPLCPLLLPCPHHGQLGRER
jgi:hypothetical protein